MPAPKIDGSASYLEDVLKVNAEISGLLDKFHLFHSSRVDAIAKQLAQLNALIHAEPALFDIANAAIGQSPKYQAWLKLLSHNQKERVALGLPNHSYGNNTESNWLNQFTTNNDETQRKTAEQIEAFIREEVGCFKKTDISRALLAQYLNATNVGKKDKETIHAYFTLLQKHQAAYAQLKLHEILKPSNQTLEQVKSRLNEKYQSNDYIKYHQSMEDLIPVIREIKQLGGKYPNLPSKDDITTATNLVLARPIEAAATAALVSQELKDTATNRLASFRAAISIDVTLANLTPVQRKAVALQLILSPIYSAADTSEAVHERNTWLVHLLSEAFPNMFTRKDGVLIVTGAYTEKGGAIYAALGLIKMFDMLDPKKFNPLNTTEDPQNPLWPMLKIIKPVDNPSYTIADKIKGYIEIIKLINSGQLKLNITPPSEQTKLLAENLLKLINQPVDEHFTIEDKTAAHLEIITLIKDHKFKINNKPPLEQAREIAASTVGAVYEASGRTNETSQILRVHLSDIYKAIESSIIVKAMKWIKQAIMEKGDRSKLPEESKTTQRRLRELISGRGKPKQTERPTESHTILATNSKMPRELKKQSNEIKVDKFLKDKPWVEKSHAEILVATNASSDFALYNKLDVLWKKFTNENEPDKKFRAFVNFIREAKHAGLTTTHDNALNDLIASIPNDALSSNLNYDDIKTAWDKKQGVSKSSKESDLEESTKPPPPMTQAEYYRFLKEGLNELQKSNPKLTVDDFMMGEQFNKEYAGVLYLFTVSALHQDDVELYRNLTDRLSILTNEDYPDQPFRSLVDFIGEAKNAGLTETNNEKFNKEIEETTGLQALINLIPKGRFSNQSDCDYDYIKTQWGEALRTCVPQSDEDEAHVIRPS